MYDRRGVAMTNEGNSSANDSPETGRSEPGLGDELLFFGETKWVPPKAAAQNPMQSRSLSSHPVVGTSGKDAASVPTRVFIDLDVMLEIQEHSIEDTTVELGGLLLGQRGEDDDGTPIVVVRESLRARHYRATRGSFTFTHDTWSDLQAQRQQLDQSLDVVGWYHTHPGWGVFLSDLDGFICDHFFSHPDDIALVVDPLQSETGLFVRRGSPGKRLPGRLSQYWLTAHRRRESDLVSWSQYFSGATTMPQPGSTFAGRPNPPIVIQQLENRNTFSASQGVLLGMLFLQTILLLAILGVAFYASGSLSERGSANNLSHREAAIDEILNRIASQGPAGIDEGYRAMFLAKAETDAANVGLHERIQSLQTTLAEREQRQATLKLELADLSEKMASMESGLPPTQGFIDTATQLWSPAYRPTFLMGALFGALVTRLVGGASLWRRKLLREVERSERLESP